jgi:hypothetical protein
LKNGVARDHPSSGQGFRAAAGELTMRGASLIGAATGIAVVAALGFDSGDWLIFVVATLLVWLLVFALVRVRANRS